MQNLEAGTQARSTAANFVRGVQMEARRKGILFVCEDATMLDVRQMLLERVGYTVWPTNSMDEASAIAQRTCPDMLLMEDSYLDSSLEASAQVVKDVCPEIIAVVLAPYFAVRQTSESVIDRFIARDQGPDLLLAQIDELFREKDIQGNSTATSSAS
jgi:CheY-like chemotaxis protein